MTTSALAPGALGINTPQGPVFCCGSLQTGYDPSGGGGDGTGVVGGAGLGKTDSSGPGEGFGG